MAARLPIPNQDDDDWGNILNTFLEVSHNGDGTLTTSAVNSAGGVVNRGNWTPNTIYRLNDQVLESNNLYVCNTAHTSGSSFSSANWNQQTNLSPVVSSLAAGNNIAITGGDGNGHGSLTINVSSVVTSLSAGTNVTLTGGDGQGHGALTLNVPNMVSSLTAGSSNVTVTGGDGNGHGALTVNVPNLVSSLTAGSNISLTGGDGSGHGAITVNAPNVAILTDGTNYGGTITVGTTAPGSPGARDLWINTSVTPSLSNLSAPTSTYSMGNQELTNIGSPTAETSAIRTTDLLAQPWTSTPVGGYYLKGALVTVVGTSSYGTNGVQGLWQSKSTHTTVSTFAAATPNWNHIADVSPPGSVTNRTLFNQTIGPLTPSATAGQAGTSVPIVMDSGAVSLVPLGITYSKPAGMGSETLTLQCTVVYNDSSTAKSSTNINNDAAGSFSTINLGGLWTDGLYIVGMSFTLSSSIASSGASTSVTIFGLNT